MAENNEPVVEEGRKRRRRNSADFGGDPGAPRWLVTYGDMVTLLLVFFVLLFSFSKLDAKKFEMALGSFRDSLGILPGGRSVVNSSLVFGGASRNMPGEGRERWTPETLKNSAESFVKRENLDGVKVLVTERGVVVSVEEQFLFESGKIDLKPGGMRTMFKLAEMFESLGVPKLSVEGHTDKVPYRGVFLNNLGLSAMRAAAVTTYMTERGGFTGETKATGFGEGRPLVPNDTKEHMALNRRVDMVVETF